MSEVEDQFENDPLDRAVANRLSKLRTMPVDTSRLDHALRAQIPPLTTARASWLRPLPLRAIAASIAVLLIVAAVLLATATGPAMASPNQMAQFHQDLVSGKTPVMQVDSIQAANQALNEQWPQSPQLPSVPAEHVMACCMKSVKNKKVACVLLRDAGVPITMTVANASDMRTPSSPTVTRGGVTYSVQAVGSLNMVMTERHGRWICLIGELPADRLMDLAVQLEF